ncbi:MAG TPA: squalene/phytoene synthase family protein, partial [Longimicrobiales bacterium]|nr:squalene/phytoene synthase family protein [Longimicrobiales bacterium]
MSALTSAADDARRALAELYSRLDASGCAAPASADGQLIRPLLSLAGVRGIGLPEDAAFWAATAAVQLAHEASLLHDDVIDGARIRRGQATVAAERGVAAALVQGDHLLTTSYRLAAATTSPAFVSSFAHAVERTVAGEKLQGAARGQVLDERAYRRIISGKSGELLGCALSAGAFLHDHARASSLYSLGRRIGMLYQMLDDLLDYCPSAATGKAPLTDFAQRHWTWPLRHLDEWTFDDDASAIAARLVTPDAGGYCPLRRSLLELEREADMTRAAVALQLPGDVIIDEMLAQWLARATAAVAAAEEDAVRTVIAAQVERATATARFFAGNSRSFSFAARLFPAEFRERTARVYAFCRITDDLADADDGATPGQRMARLDLWLRLSRMAYDGGTSLLSLVDDVMRDAARSGVPFAYVEELVEGMRMDVRAQAYATLDELRLYSHRVAGVVGQWLTRLCGVSDERTLEHAARLGHALQLTNILRDVGEDFARGRVYLPADLMAAYGVGVEDLQRFADGAPVSDDYVQLMERLMTEADRDYAFALAALPALPPQFRRAIAVAARVYHGIHGALRDNGYDNFRARAVTTLPRKLRLAASALGDAKRRHGPAAFGGGAFDGTAPGRPHATRPASNADPQRMRESARAARLPGRVGAISTLLLLGAALLAGLGAQEPGVVEHHAAAAAAVAAAPAEPERHVDLIRATFFVAVSESDAVDDGLSAVTTLRTHAPQFAAHEHALLVAYEGAFTALQAKHGTWPVARLRNARAGLALLDSAVTLAPAHAEVRYL